jgi:cytidine deaminase
MESLIYNMYRKRFGISKELTYFEQENICDCGGKYHHIACCFKDNDNILSFGINYFMNNSLGNKYMIHAEHDAIRKLPYNDKRRKSINILVLRFTKTNKLCMSRPCLQCLQYMLKICPKKGYNVKNIYYSTNNGNIEKTKINKLMKENIHYSKSYYQKNFVTLPQYSGSLNCL